MNEFELIARYFDRGPPRRALLGIGDDGAMIGPSRVARTVVCDLLVAGRHFFPDVAPDSLGHKALAVNLSDLAAMGARPEAFLLGLAIEQVDEAWLDGFSRGLFALADRFDCELIGGDTTRGPLTISITAIGELDAGAVSRRDRAEPGDDLWVSGELGAAAIAVAARRAQPDRPVGVDRARAQHRLDWPEPRVALGLALRHLARAAIDISDGLVADLGHLATRSRVGLHVQADQVPVDPALAAMPDDAALQAALNGGDDYELAFTALPENRLAIEAIGRQMDLRLSRIGEVSAGQGVQVVDARGRPVRLARMGHDHFAAAGS